MSRKIRQLMALYRRDPVAFVYDFFGKFRDSTGRPFGLDPFQSEFLAALVENQRLGLLACKGPGKSAVLAMAILWYMTVFEYSNVICTSITAENLKDGLWKELSKWMNVHPMFDELFEKTNTRIMHRKHKGLWFASARAWPKSGDETQQADSMAGVHQEYTMAVIDEAGGVPLSVLHALEAVLTSGENCKLLLAGNPTSTSGSLYQACKIERHLYWTKEINNDPEDPNRCTRADIKYAQKLIAEYGRNSDVVRINVLGKFPRTGADNLISEEEVERAMKRHIREDVWRDSMKRLGVDVARFGDDATVITPRQGLVCFRQKEIRGARTNEVAQQVLMAKNRFDSEMEFIDCGGVGAGVEDACVALGMGPVPVDFGGKPDDPEMFRNKRAEMWWRMCSWIRKGGALPPDPELKNDLVKMKLKDTQGQLDSGKIQLESKADFKKRTGTSPDKGDSLALTFALPEMPGKGSGKAMGPGMADDGTRRRPEPQQHGMPSWMVQDIGGSGVEG